MSDMQAFGSWRIILLEDASLGDDGDVLTRVGANGAEFKPSGGGGAAWGDITGTLSAQTDLQAALDAVTFDQDLNTDDAVEFGSVETLNLRSGDFETTRLDLDNFYFSLGPPLFGRTVEGGGSLAAGQYTIAVSYVFAGAETKAMVYNPETVALNQKITLDVQGGSLGGGFTGGTIRVYVGIDGPPDQYVDFPLGSFGPYELTSVAGSTPGTPLLVSTLNVISLVSGELAFNFPGDFYINGTPTITEDIVLTGLGTLGVLKGHIITWTPV